jgi:hypothetical protein
VEGTCKQDVDDGIDKADTSEKQVTAGLRVLELCWSGPLWRARLAGSKDMALLKDRQQDDLDKNCMGMKMNFARLMEHSPVWEEDKIWW